MAAQQRPICCPYSIPSLGIDVGGIFRGLFMCTPSRGGSVIVAGPFLEVVMGKVTIQTTGGPVEIEATVRPSGLAIHPVTEERCTLRWYVGAAARVPKSVGYSLRVGVTHAASGRIICRAMTIEMATRMARRLERSGIDWTLPMAAVVPLAVGPRMEADMWHSDQIRRLAGLGVAL